MSKYGYLGAKGRCGNTADVVALVCFGLFAFAGVSVTFDYADQPVNRKVKYINNTEVLT